MPKLPMNCFPLSTMSCGVSPPRKWLVKHPDKHYNPPRWCTRRQPAWQNRAHFLGAAAEAMRRILVENARRKLRLKRGGGAERDELHESVIKAPADDEKVIKVHEALETLESANPEMARIVTLRFFVGLKHEEIATLLGVNEKTVRRHWEVAKVKLFQTIKALNRISPSLVRPEFFADALSRTRRFVFRLTSLSNIRSKALQLFHFLSHHGGNAVFGQIYARDSDT
jgi:RNA polymerase sigma factor (sigma-70 family)